MPGKVGGNRKPQTFRDCAFCGRQFGPLKRLSARFCSQRCAYDDRAGKPGPRLGRTFGDERKVQPRLCEKCGESFRPVKDTKRRRQRYCSRTCSAGAPGGSRLERAVREALTGDGREFAEQVRLGRYHPDFLLGRLVVEADGSYWHDRPDVAARDRRRDAWMTARGYCVLRLREDVIDAGPSAILAAIDASASPS